MVAVVVGLVFYIAALIAGGFMTASKHRAAPIVLALLLGWLGVLVALFVPARTEAEAAAARERQSQDTGSWKGTMG